MGKARPKLKTRIRPEPTAQDGGGQPERDPQEPGQTAARPRKTQARDPRKRGRSQSPGGIDERPRKTTRRVIDEERSQGPASGEGSRAGEPVGAKRRGRQMGCTWTSPRRSKRQRGKEGQWAQTSPALQEKERSIREALTAVWAAGITLLQHPTEGAHEKVVVETEGGAASPGVQSRVKRDQVAVLAEEEADRLLTMDEWREGVVRALAAEEAERQSRKAVEHKRYCKRQGKCGSDERDARLALTDEWRAEWGNLKEQEREAWKATKRQEEALQRKREGEKLQSLEEAMTRSYYAVLGLGRGATPAEIKAAGKRVSLDCHPDKYPNSVKRATRVFQAMRRALDTLSDPQAREAYDRDLAARERAEQQRREKPSRPEPTGECGNFPVLSLEKRCGWTPSRLKAEEEQIRKARVELAIHGSPSSRGLCWVVLPGLKISKADFLSTRLCQALGMTWYDIIVHVEGDSAAISVEPGLRPFETLEEAETVVKRIREQQRRGWFW